MIYNYQMLNMIDNNQRNFLFYNSILFSKIDSTSNKHEKLLNEIRLHRKQLGNKVLVGKSLTVQFLVNDKSHSQSKEIYAELNRLTLELLADGYVFDPSWISRKLRDDETVISALCGHSEKLTLAFNLIQKPIPSFIQIKNNIRLCGDC
ncbi:unnamed protein product, partial [Rotaria sp. Silwood1]